MTNIREHNDIVDIERALATYKETVSPPKHCLQVLLSHIPEQKTIRRKGVIRSPYMWLALTQVVVACSIVFAIVSTINTPAYQSNPFYQIDKQVDDFETTIMEEDYKLGTGDYSGRL